MTLLSDQLDVLVVDADASVGGLLLSVLRRARFKAGWLGDSVSLFAALKPTGDSAAPRLLLAERALPGCDAEQLQSLLSESSQPIPLLITSAYLEPEQRSALCDAPGVAGLIEKPFDLKRLVEDVSAALDQLPAAERSGQEVARAGFPSMEAKSQAWFPGASSGLRGSEPNRGAQAC